MNCTQKNACPCPKTACKNHAKCCDCIAKHTALDGVPYCILGQQDKSLEALYHKLAQRFNAPMSKLASFPTLHTERMILRAPTLEDAQDMHEYASDEQVARFMYWDRHESMDTTLGHINTCLSRIRAGISLDFVFWHKHAQKVIGAGGSWSLEHTPHFAEIGYVLNKDFWGQGLAKEAMDAVIDYLFNVMCVHKIKAKHYAPNKNSGRVMQKLGMQYVGTFVQEDFIKGEYLDTVYYELLNSNASQKG